jgi:pyridoxine 4-dehydrogenase
MAAGKSCTPAQLALAWVLAQGDFIVPIPGTLSVAHVAENAAAADVVLSEDERAELDRLFAPGAVAGARFETDRSKELNI